MQRGRVRLTIDDLFGPEEPVGPPEIPVGLLAAGCREIVERLGGSVIAQGDGSYVVAARNLGLSLVSTSRGVIFVETDLGESVSMLDIVSLVAFHLDKAGKLKSGERFVKLTD